MLTPDEIVCTRQPLITPLKLKDLVKILSSVQAFDMCYKRQLTKSNLIRTRQNTARLQKKLFSYAIHLQLPGCVP